VRPDSRIALVRVIKADEEVSRLMSRGGDVPQWYAKLVVKLMGYCDILAQGLIGLIEYSYHQSIPSFPEAHLQRTPGLNVLDPEQFHDG
jgi:hypothetical protein